MKPALSERGYRAQAHQVDQLSAKEPCPLADGMGAKTQHYASAQECDSSMQVTCPHCGTTSDQHRPASGGALFCHHCDGRFNPLLAETAGVSIDNGKENNVALWVPAAGDRFAAYELQSVLGRGGMATVWQARQASLGRDVAVKILHPHLIADPDVMRRFDREAAALTRLDHANILPVLERGTHEGRPWLVMPLAGTQSLRDRMSDEAGNNKRVASGELAQILHDICLGLAHAHSRGLVHRDIKPENILLDTEGRPRIADFGIAHWLSSPDMAALTRLTHTNMVVGTVAYMAPEQSEPGATIDLRADLYGLGVVAYEALTGHRPVGRFEDPGPSVLGANDQQREQWNRIILSLLERNPERRPANAMAVAGMLRSLCSGTLPASVAAPSAPPAAAMAPGDAVSPDEAASIAPPPVAPEASTGPDGAAAKAEASPAASVALERAAMVLDRLGGAGKKAHIQNAKHQRRHKRKERRHAQAEADRHGPAVHGRKLYRPRSGALLAGTCAGLGAWTGINPWWIRLAALFLLPGGFMVLFPAYLVAVLVIPPCPDLHYRPLPLNSALPARSIGWLAGVCAGLARISGPPAWVWRLIFCFTMPVSFIAYIAMAAILPAPKTRMVKKSKAPPVPDAADLARAHGVGTVDEPKPVAAPRARSEARFWFILACGFAAMAWWLQAAVNAGAAPSSLLNRGLLWLIAGVALLTSLVSLGRKASKLRDGGSGSALVVLGGLSLTLFLTMQQHGQLVFTPQSGAQIFLFAVAGIIFGTIFGAIRGRPVVLVHSMAVIIGLGVTWIASTSMPLHTWMPVAVESWLPVTLMWLVLLLPWLVAWHCLHWLLRPVLNLDAPGDRPVYGWPMAIMSLGLVAASGLMFIAFA